MSTAGEYRELIAELRAQDWSITPTKRGHWRAAAPDKAAELVHFSESGDRHAYLNTLKELKVRGFVWPPPSKRKMVTGVSTPPWPEEMPEQPAQPAELERTCDQVFQDLKEARLYHSLAEQEYAAKLAALESARAALESASRERAASAAQLEAKKKTFDTLFSGGSP